LSDKETAAYQRRTRQQHAQERAQDYVEAIADLIALHGEARATDLARSLGVTHVTVIRTVQRLQRDGLVTSLPYRSIFLTEAGRKLASKARTRHRTVVAFLEALGISSSVARADAEGIEHHVSPETLAAFERFLAERKDRETRSEKLKCSAGRRWGEFATRRSREASARVAVRLSRSDGVAAFETFPDVRASLREEIA
jgi:DtxR family manganese transport transcriptional regulator